MDERGIHPKQAQESDAALSVARRLYCQLLVNSVVSLCLDTSRPDLNSNLLRAFEESMSNAEKRVKVIVEKSMLSGEANAAEPEKCVAEFQQRLHYMEEYLSTCFQTRNVSHLYGEMEVEEPATSGPQYGAAQRAMAGIRRQLQEELDVQNSSLLDGLFQHKLVRDWERDSILARRTTRDKAEELLRTVTPRLDQTRLQQQFLPLLREDHKHLAEELSRAFEEEKEKEVGGSEAKCCVCQFHEVVEVKRLARHLNKVVSPSLDSDLSNPALTNTSKMHRLKEEVSLEQVIGSLQEPYPALHQQFCSERVRALECFCARLREAQTSDCVDGLGSQSVTDINDVACMSDLQSMLGDEEARKQENIPAMSPLQKVFLLDTEGCKLDSHDLEDDGFQLKVSFMASWVMFFCIFWAARVVCDVSALGDLYAASAVWIIEFWIPLSICVWFAASEEHPHGVRDGDSDGLP